LFYARGGGCGREEEGEEGEEGEMGTVRYLYL